MNKLNWNTTQSNDDRYLYLTIMRDLKQYCARGYCEVEITLYRFVALPQSYIKRILPTLTSAEIIGHVIVDWACYESVHRFLRMMTAIVVEMNHVAFDQKAFNDAIEEFTQYLKYKKR